MSSLIIPLTHIAHIEPHPNADALEIAHILGWQVVVQKGMFSIGDKVVYFPPDTVLPQEVSDQFGVTKYLSNGRVRSVKLRGQPSFGFVQPAPDGVEGDNLAEYYGAEKYIAPLKISQEDVDRDIDGFERYTGIENLRNFQGVFEVGEPVVVTEKIHGTNSRFGMINGELMAGSSRLRRRESPNSLYWMPRRFLEKYVSSVSAHSVIVYGEIYGGSMQKGFDYGLKQPSYRAFDIAINGKYLDFADFIAVCAEYQIPTVPVLDIVPYSPDVIKYAEGQTTVDGGKHIREGIVVRPVVERFHPKTGRVILKYVSDSWLVGDYTPEETEDI